MMQMFSSSKKKILITITILLISLLFFWLRAGNDHANIRNAASAWSNETTNMFCAYDENYDGINKTYWRAVEDNILYGYSIFGNPDKYRRFVQVEQTTIAIHMPLAERNIMPEELGEFCEDIRMKRLIFMSFVTQIERCAHGRFGHSAFRFLPYELLDPRWGPVMMRTRVRLEEEEPEIIERAENINLYEIDEVLEKVNAGLPEIFRHFGDAIVCR